MCEGEKEEKADLDVHVDLVTLGNVAEVAACLQVRDLGLRIEFVELISDPLRYRNFIKGLRIT